MNDPENQNPEDYPKMRIAQMPLKKSFKVVLDSNTTASYSGPQFDARFTVDLNQIIREPWRMKKSYLMTFFILEASRRHLLLVVLHLQSYTSYILI